MGEDLDAALRPRARLHRGDEEIRRGAGLSARGPDDLDAVRRGELELLLLGVDDEEREAAGVGGGDDAAFPMDCEQVGEASRVDAHGNLLVCRKNESVLKCTSIGLYVHSWHNSGMAHGST